MSLCCVRMNGQAGPPTLITPQWIRLAPNLKQRSLEFWGPPSRWVKDIYSPAQVTTALRWPLQ